MDRSGMTAGVVALVLVSGGVASAAYGVPGRLVWDTDGPKPAAAGETERREEPREPLRFAPAPALAPVPLRYAPAWLPGGLREVRRDAMVSGSPSSQVTRVWMPQDVAEPGDAPTELIELAGQGEPTGPYLSVEVEQSPDDTVQLGWALHDAAGEPGGYQVFEDSAGYTWEPEPHVVVRVHQHGLGLDRATMWRIASSVRPATGAFTFPLQPRELPAGLTELTWNTFVTAVVRPDPRSGQWRGSVNWCLAWEITVDRDGPPELAADRWRRLTDAAGKPWTGLRRLDDRMSRTMVAVERRPGTVVTVSVLHPSGHGPATGDLARVAASVDVPG